MRALESLDRVSSPSPVVEVIVVEGYNPSLQRNEGGKQARGDILYLFDDDSIAPAHIFEQVLEHFYCDRVIAVGGPSLTPPTDCFLQKCFGLALGSPFGSYKSSRRYSPVGRARETTEIELIGCNLALRRKMFLEEGGLNQLLHPNEETELLDRLLRKGYTMVYDPDAYVYRSQRESLYKFIVQIFMYGKGRMEQTLLMPSRIRPFYFVSLCFCLYLILLPWLRNVFWYFIPFLLYFILAVGESLRVTWNKRDWRYLPVMPQIFFLMHISHGIGLLWGLITWTFRRKGDPLPSDIRIFRYENNSR